MQNQFYRTKLAADQGNVTGAALLDTVRLPVWHFTRVEYTNVVSEILRDDDLQLDFGVAAGKRTLLVT